MSEVLNSKIGQERVRQIEAKALRKMRHPFGWFKKNIAYIIAALAGFTLMPAAIEAAYKERGYFGIGGEYLLPLLFVLIVAAVSEARDMFQLKEPEGESYEE